MHNLLLVAAAALVLAADGADLDGDGKVSDAEAKAEMSADGMIATKPGLWEMKITFSDINGEGVPAAALAQMKTQATEGTTSRSCITKEETEKPDGNFFGVPTEATCSFDELDRTGNNIKVAMTCKPGGNMTMKTKMDGSFGAEIYTMTIEQSTEGTAMGAVKMTGKIDGKRLGDCPA